MGDSRARQPPRREIDGDSERYRGLHASPLQPLPPSVPSSCTVHPISLSGYERHRRARNWVGAFPRGRDVATTRATERIDATRTHSLPIDAWRRGEGWRGHEGSGGGALQIKQDRGDSWPFRPPGQTTSPHDANARRTARTGNAEPLPSRCTPLPLRDLPRASRDTLSDRAALDRRASPAADCECGESKDARSRRTLLLYSGTVIPAHERAEFPLDRARAASRSAVSRYRDSRMRF